MSHPYEGLTPDCVISCVEAIGLRSDLRLLALNSYENRVYQVGVEDAELWGATRSHSLDYELFEELLRTLVQLVLFRS